MNVHTAESSAVADEVYLEEHGIPGTAGQLAAPVGIMVDDLVADHAIWIDHPSRTLDLHVGFRARFDLAEAGAYRLATQAAATFRVWIDDQLLVHGPLRFAPALPEYDDREIWLDAGAHVIHVEAHDEGIMHRTVAPIDAFMVAVLSGPDGAVPLEWRARELDHYVSTGLRVSPLLGWMEVQTASIDWRRIPESDPGWRATEARGGAIADRSSTPSAVTLPIWPRSTMRESARGIYSDTFSGYDLDDPASQFLLADPDPHPGAPIDGSWWRYDLECVRIGSVELTVEFDEPGTVIIGYAERLTPAGRPSPVVALSAGATRMIQQYAVPAGVSTISPLQSLGGRYIEVRLESAEPARVLAAEFVERDFLGEPLGSFESSDPVLDEIWATGIRTLRSATEDAIVDSVRERGEWLGDVVSVAHRIMQAGWGVSAPVRRALIHAAAGARPDGLVAGCGPGELLYLGTYAAQWFEGCLRVAAAETDDRLLHELLGAARANIAAIYGTVADDGTTDLPWGFVDWGYAAPREGRPDAAVLAHVVLALDNFIRWLDRLDLTDESRLWASRRDRVAEIAKPIISSAVSEYHASTLGYHAGITDRDTAITHIRARFAAGFPFDQDAARLKNPTRAGATSVTPYFSNYSLPLLLDAGLGEEARDLWHRGWGWMLSEGATTWWEVFDDRWSRCHAWSGAPTWQISTYTLGLRRTERRDTWRLAINTLGLTRASGRVPLGGGEFVDIQWEYLGDHVTARLSASVPTQVEVRGQVIAISSDVAVRLTQSIGDLYE